MENEILSLKDYAKRMNVTYEAVRRQLQRYENELEGHVIRRNKTRYLDEYAVDFLNKKRRESPIIMYQMDQSEEIERLRKEKEALLIKVASQADEITELVKWKSEHIEAIATNQIQKIQLKENQKEIKYLERRNSEQSNEIAFLVTAKEYAEQQVDQLESELANVQKTVCLKDEVIQNARFVRDKERLEHQNQTEQLKAQYEAKMEQQREEERSKRDKERLEHQNQMDQQKAQYEAKMEQQREELKAQHQAELEQQRKEDDQQKAVEVAEAKEEWKEKSLIERVFKK